MGKESKDGALHGKMGIKKYQKSIYWLQENRVYSPWRGKKLMCCLARVGQYLVDYEPFKIETMIPPKFSTDISDIITINLSK
ncbi:Tyrosine-protein phosphatase 3 [Fusarium oxysporum f. sp. albedinis]|nr:Tyrosine-protein phosphatase 3 [Fusarium oxysporum f. sp. albedinis]